jgi:hypothetical protein
MDYLRLLFGAICRDKDEVETRSMLAFSLVIGHQVMAADHGAHSHADVRSSCCSCTGPPQLWRHQ